LLALGRAHDSIIDGNWAGIRLGIVVEQAMKPFHSVGHVTSADGPNIELRPQASLALAMILHELATNAAKYGAFSGEAGQVAISWRLEDDDPIAQVALDWTESGGPLVKPPTRRGHGTSFVERSVAFELEGTANIEFARQGLRAFLRFPLARASMPAPRPRGDRQEPI
jgi:two-component sensor histidine kinase